MYYTNEANSSLELAAWPEYVADIMTISTVEGSLRRWGEAAYLDTDEVGRKNGDREEQNVQKVRDW